MFRINTPSFSAFSNLFPTQDDVDHSTWPLVIQLDVVPLGSSPTVAFKKLMDALDLANSNAGSGNTDYRIIMFEFYIEVISGVPNYRSWGLAQDWNQKPFNSEPDQTWLNV